jgi:hypothetical protein
MTYIYSDKKIDNLRGCYLAPFRFNGVDKRAKRVYTDDKKIADAYNGICEVLQLPKATRITKKVTNGKDEKMA